MAFLTDNCQPLTLSSYAKVFMALEMMEHDFQDDQLANFYAQHNVLLQRANNGQYRVTVPGLSEGRPSVQRGLSDMSTCCFQLVVEPCFHSLSSG